MSKKYAETINEFLQRGGRITYRGLNSANVLNPPQEQQELLTGYLNSLYHVFLNNQLVEVSYIAQDEYGRNIKKYVFKVE